MDVVVLACRRRALASYLSPSVFVKVGGRSGRVARVQ